MTRSHDTRSHDEVAALIPWYANGTLPENERAAVEKHMGGCAECSALLDDARLLMTGGLAAARLADGFEAAGATAAAGTPGALEVHPQAQILREYADRSEALGEETAAAVRIHLAKCEPCRTAVEAAAASGAEASDRDRPLVSPLHAPPRRTAAQPSSGLWAWLSGTLLQPAPAAVYLLLLLIALPVAILRESPGTGAGGTGILPPPLTITGERVFRQRPDEGAPPLPLDLPQAPRAMIQLALRTRIDREDLDDPGAAFEVTIERAGEVIWSATTSGDSFSADNELRLLLPVDLLRGAPATIAIHFVKPGDPLHDAELFRRSIEAR